MKDNKTKQRRVVISAADIKDCIMSDQNPKLPVVLSVTDGRGGASYVLASKQQVSEMFMSKELQGCGVKRISVHDGKTYIDMSRTGKYYLDNGFLDDYEDGNALKPEDTASIYAIETTRN